MERIDFIDRETGEAVPVCAKPNCAHNDDLCNAYFHAPLEIHAYDGMLYVVAHGSEDSTMSLYRFSMDGSEKVEQKTLFSYEEEDNAGVSQSFIIHRGYGYLVTNWMQKDRKERTQTLYRISLDEDTEKEKIYEIKGYSPMIFLNQGEKNRLYFTAERYLDQDLKEYETNSFYLDLLKGTITELDVPDGYVLLAAKNGKVYYYHQDEKALYWMNEDGTGQEKVFEWEYDNMCICQDERYLYVSNEFHIGPDELPETEKKVAVLEYGGNVVRELTFADLGEGYLKWSNGEQLLICQNGLDDGETTYKLMDIKP